jgi:hypothetical protein
MPEPQRVALPDLVKADFAGIEQRYLASVLTSNGLYTFPMPMKDNPYAETNTINIDDPTNEEDMAERAERIAKAMKTSGWWNKITIGNEKYGDLKITERTIQDCTERTIQDCTEKFPNASILLGDTCFSTEESAKITEETWEKLCRQKLCRHWDEALELKGLKSSYTSCPRKYFYPMPVNVSEAFKDRYFNHSKENNMSKTATAKIEERLYLRDIRVDNASPETLLSFIEQLRNEISSLEEVLETTESKYITTGINERTRTIATLTELLDKKV